MHVALTDNAKRLLERRYYAPNETHDGLLDRVSFGNAEFRALMSENWFWPNSPTIMNAGLRGTLSACFKFDIDDTLLDGPNSILATRAKAAAVAKYGGGVGYYLGNIRPKGSVVNSVHRKACGPVAVLRDLHGVKALITQGGKRDLAQMAILPVFHDDIEEFITCKNDNPNALDSFNISVAWYDRCIEEVRAKSGKYYELWLKQVKCAWTTGDPGVYFPDIVELTNPTPWLGKLTGTNPCGEVPLLNDEPCNLGSLVLSKFVVQGEILWPELKHYARTATQFLDTILDNNRFPVQSITDAALRTRKLGLGVMAWADMLTLLRIPYDCKEAVDLAGEVAKTINDAAHEESYALAEKYGPYPGYNAAQAKTKPIRNATNTCIAPTGSIYIIAGCDGSGIEPFFALEQERTTYEGMKFKERVKCMEQVPGFIPKTTNEISLEWHIRHQAAWQKHVDLAVSKTINMPNSATEEDISNAYLLMHELGCKGGTIYRDGCRSEQVLVDTSKKAHAIYGTGATQSRRVLPIKRNSFTYKLNIGEFEGYLTVGMYDDGKPGEIFVKAQKVGSTMTGMLDALSISVSLALQHGTPLETLCRLYIGTIYEPNGMTRNKDIPMCSSITDYMFRLLEQEFITKQSPAASSGMLCTACGSQVRLEGGCYSCPSCGWSRCG